MKILFIAYYFEPYSGVGAKRVSYWAQNLHTVFPHTTCDVITAIPQIESAENIFYVENSCTSWMSLLIKDEGLSWTKCLKNYLHNIDLTQYAAVVISGGPFMHFGIAKYLKEKSATKVIFDFRDPFYGNPRFSSSLIRDTIKRYYQNLFLKYADAVISVNGYCANLIDFEPVHLVDNGFDENKIVEISPAQFDGERVQLIAVGKIYDDITVTPFFQVLHDDKQQLNYVGKHSFDDEHRPFVTHYGPQSYLTTLSYIKGADICILFTGGKAFESTTKVFDFLAFNKKILIITEGDVHTGELQNITKEYPNIEWSENSENDIQKALHSLIQKEIVNFDSSRYSRQNGLRKLLSIIKNIVE